MVSRSSNRTPAPRKGRPPLDVDFDRTWSRVRRYLPPDFRDDCISEAMLALWKSRDRWQRLTPAEQPGYLIICARRAILRAVRVEIRVEQRRISLDEYEAGGVALVPAGECDTSDEALARMSLADQISRPEIAAAVRALPPREQEILDLAFRRGLTDAEIGRDRGITTEAVKKQRQRALSKLRRQLAPSA